MAQTHLEVFDTTLQKTNYILKSIEEQLGWDNRHLSYSALRSVLHTLRDRLPAEQAVAFAAQLPVLLRGVYFEGWKPGATPIKMTREQFISEVERLANPPFEVPTEEVIGSVMLAIGDAVDEAEIEKLKSILPDYIADLLEGV